MWNAFFRLKVKLKLFQATREYGELIQKSYYSKILENSESNSRLSQPLITNVLELLQVKSRVLNRHVHRRLHLNVGGELVSKQGAKRSIDTKEIVLASGMGINSNLCDQFRFSENVHLQFLCAMQSAVLSLNQACQASKANQANSGLRELESSSEFNNLENLASPASQEQLSLPLQTKVVPTPRRHQPRELKEALYFDETSGPVEASPQVSMPRKTIERNFKLRLTPLQAKERRKRLKAIKKRHEDFYERLGRQRKREMEAYQKAAEEYSSLLNEMTSKGLGCNLPVGKALILSWYNPLKTAIEKEIECFKENQWKTPEHKNFGPLLLGVEPEILAVVTTHRIIEKLLEEHGRYSMDEKGESTDSSYFPRSQLGFHSFVKMVSAASAVGRAVEVEVN